MAFIECTANKPACILILPKVNQAQQQEIEAGNQISQQIGPNLLRDMAAASVKNEKMKALLAKHGYNVQVNKDAPKDAPAPKP
jgi:hypothetical protein